MRTEQSILELLESAERYLTSGIGVRRAMAVGQLHKAIALLRKSDAQQARGGKADASAGPRAERADVDGGVT